MGVAITVEGANTLRGDLDSLGADFKNLRAPLTALVQQVVRPHIAAAFEASGPGWKPLSPAYAKWKRIHYGGAPLLVRTGKMRTALTGGVGSTIIVSDTSITIDPSEAVPYWKFHEGGTGRLPKRSMLQFDAAAQDAFGKTISDWLSDRAHEYGFAVYK